MPEATFLTHDQAIDEIRADLENNSRWMMLPDPRVLSSTAAALSECGLDETGVTVYLDQGFHAPVLKTNTPEVLSLFAMIGLDPPAVVVLIDKSMLDVLTIGEVFGITPSDRRDVLFLQSDDEGLYGLPMLGAVALGVNPQRAVAHNDMMRRRN